MPTACTPECSQSSNRYFYYSSHVRISHRCVRTRVMSARPKSVLVDAQLYHLYIVIQFVLISVQSCVHDYVCLCVGGERVRDVHAMGTTAIQRVIPIPTVPLRTSRVLWLADMLVVYIQTHLHTICTNISTDNIWALSDNANSDPRLQTCSQAFDLVLDRTVATFTIISNSTSITSRVENVPMRTRSHSV